MFHGFCSRQVDNTSVIGDSESATDVANEQSKQPSENSVAVTLAPESSNSTDKIATTDTAEKSCSSAERGE